ncbi:MAG: Fibrillarin-like rRNA/tRNA 2'-O-methyltransferase [Candidatus Bathyarchaeota archaeon BA2]|nr:MAG: Fibrillarin-like rRNA/tRNA 2'-O-methyltransferase [Candidatus Bathyarchaeota archaeon BA2]
MAVDVKPHPRFPGVYWASLEDGSRRLATANLIPGKSVYGERLVRFRGEEYRLWDPYRSKFAASILKSLEAVPIQPNHKVLYLGAASGTTASHVSDIVGEKGHVYCVEFAARVIRELVNNVCAFRSNMSPVLADARLPERYSTLVGKVDDVYCDIAQPEQARVLADNADLFLVDGGWVMLAVKAQSIDVTREPSEIYEQEINIMKVRGFRVSEVVHLEPYDKAHAMIVAKKET